MALAEDKKSAQSSKAGEAETAGVVTRSGVALPMAMPVSVLPIASPRKQQSHWFITVSPMP